MVIYTNTLTDYKNHSLLIFLRRTRCAAASSSPPPPAYSSSASLSHNVPRISDEAVIIFLINSFSGCFRLHQIKVQLYGEAQATKGSEAHYPLFSEVPPFLVQTDRPEARYGLSSNI